MKNHLLSLIVIAVLVFVGCKPQIVEIDLPPHDPALVVNCVFSPDSVWHAHVTASQGIQVADAPKAVENATVVIFENGAVVETLVHIVDGIYTAQNGTRPQVGHTYTIEASAPGYAKASGTDYVPVTVIPYGMEWRDSIAYNQFQGYNGEFSFKIDDPAGEENFYLLGVYQLDTFFDGTDTLYFVDDIYVEAFDPALESDFWSGDQRFNDGTFDGTSRTIRVQLSSDQHALPTTLFFGLSSISKSYYLYVKSMSVYSQNEGNPLSEPTRVYSNMTPGAGIMAGYSTVYALLP